MSFNLVLIRVVTALLLCYNDASADEELDWWEAATFYQIYPRSFMDSNGDGIGDLNGIISRIGYLKYLGVNAAWISPIFTSPMVDNGYDIANFTDIDPIFGTMQDFDRLLHQAHKMGIKILLDFVPNHSSDECDWFQKSIRRDPEYEHFYVWDDGKIDPATGQRVPPSNWQSAFGGSAWTWNDQRQQYYLHQFDVKQPDFDMRNRKVRDRLLEILGFWLDRGVDGFRVDAIPFYIEKRLEDGTYPDQPAGKVHHTENQPENVELLYEWRHYLDNYQRTHGGETRFMLGEAYGTIDVLNNYIRDETRAGVQMPMNLNLVYEGNGITATIIEYWANYWMNVMWKNHRISNWVVGNHDNSRLASRVGLNKADLILILVHTLPGASVTYNGEEIGMTDGETGCTSNCNFRDVARTPMQWDKSKNAGFSRAEKTWLPVNPNHVILNVKTEFRQERSTLNIFRDLVKLKRRPAFRAFKEDDTFSYAAYNKNVFTLMRTDKVTEEYRILANVGNQIELVTGLSDKKFKYIVLNTYSPHRKGDKVDLSEGIFLIPFEAVVLRRKL